MNQIPNIEETDSIGEKLRWKFHNWLITETTSAYGVPSNTTITKWWINEISQLRQSHHHQQQKAKEEEKERIAKILLEDKNKVVQAVGRALTNQAELDQDKK